MVLNQNSIRIFLSENRRRDVISLDQPQSQDFLTFCWKNVDTRGDVGPLDPWDHWTMPLISKSKNNRKSGVAVKYFFFNRGNAELIKNGEVKHFKTAEKQVSFEALKVTYKKLF